MSKTFPLAVRSLAWFVIITAVILAEPPADSLKKKGVNELSEAPLPDIYIYQSMDNSVSQSIFGRTRKDIGFGKFSIVHSLKHLKDKIERLFFNARPNVRVNEMVKNG